MFLLQFLFQQKVKEGPTRDEILQATSDLPSPPPQKSHTETIDSLVVCSNFITDISSQDS